MKQIVTIFAASLMIVAFNSCQKSETETTINETLLSQQETQADEVLTNVDLVIDEAIDLKSSELKSATVDSSSYLSDCATVTVNTESDPQVMTIDFGSSCTGKDGKVRSGKIIVTATSFKSNPSERTKTFDNYYVDEKKIDGTVVKTITKDKVNNIRTAVVQEDVTILFPNDEGSVQRSTYLTREYHLNESGTKTDNQIYSWGTVESTHSNGVTVTKTITEETPLLYLIECQQIVSGLASFTNTKGRSWTIDYGNGDCDGVATLTKGDKTKEITLN
jgi:hypothetical protein